MSFQNQSTEISDWGSVCVCGGGGGGGGRGGGGKINMNGIKLFFTSGQSY